jgi:hypothetical protein
MFNHTIFGAINSVIQRARNAKYLFTEGTTYRRGVSKFASAIPRTETFFTIPAGFTCLKNFCALLTGNFYHENNYSLYFEKMQTFQEAIHFDK